MKIDGFERSFEVTGFQIHLNYQEKVKNVNDGIQIHSINPYIQTTLLLGISNISSNTAKETE